MGRESSLHLARVYIAQARATPWLGWKFQLLEWAAKHRLAAAKQTGQMELFF